MTSLSIPKIYLIEPYRDFLIRSGLLDGGDRDTVTEDWSEVDVRRLLKSRNIDRWKRKFFHRERVEKKKIDRILREGPREDVPRRERNHAVQAPPDAEPKRWLSGERRGVLAKQTYAPASLRNKPKLLRAYSLLFNDFGSSRTWTGPVSTIAVALKCSERSARERVNELKDAGVLEVERRPGQESQYRLLLERTYVELPLMLVLLGSCAVCAVWAALRTMLGRGRSALKCATAFTQVAWATIQRLSGRGRTAVAKALRWLREHGWLSRRIVWASVRPIRRAVCRWKLCLRTPAEECTPPQRECGLPPSGRDSRNIVEPQAEPSTDSGVGMKALNAAIESGAEGLDRLTAFRKHADQLAQCQPTPHR